MPPARATRGTFARHARIHARPGSRRVVARVTPGRSLPCPAMERLHGLEALPVDAEATVVTVGFFDGVHRGHRAVLERTAEAAVERGVPAVAVTFDRHPREVLAPGLRARLLTTVDRKARLIEAGVDVLVVLEFTPAFSGRSADDFIENILIEGLHAAHCVMGANFTFGHRAAGTVELLIERGPSLGFSAERVELFELEGRPVSSSSIREALARGDLEWPRWCARPAVRAGRNRRDGRRSRSRAGILPDRQPAHLAAPAPSGSGDLRGARPHGERRPRRGDQRGDEPHVRNRALHVESYLLDFDGDLVGRDLGVEFWAYLRDEERFETPGALAGAIADDVVRTREIVVDEA